MNTAASTIQRPAVTHLYHGTLKKKYGEEKLGIVPATDIEFVEEKDRVYIVKKEGPGNRNNKFRKLRGVATVRMTTDEIMALTRK